MQPGRYIGAAALAIAVTAFSMKTHAVSNAENREVAAIPPPPIAVAVAAPNPAAVPVPASSPVSPRARRRGGLHSRFGDLNRYPGPIPTPAEWTPPNGPVRIALQAGHWRASEAPDELAGLKDNGTSANGTPEWQVNLALARKTAELLEEKGYVVDILPAVVPPGYRAHLFIAIHADGSADSTASGYRIAAPRRDATGRASRMVALLENSYGKATGLRQLPDVTRRMENYYAFNFRRYEHALNPMTIGVIIETGFLTSPSDRHLLVDESERVARGIVDAVVAFPLTPPPITPEIASGN